MSVEKYFKNLSPNDVFKGNGCDQQHRVDRDPSRIPEDISHVTCHQDAGGHCVQIYLPMEVAYINKSQERRQKSKKNKGCLDKAENKTIQVPSGCYSKTTHKRS